MWPSGVTDAFLAYMSLSTIFIQIAILIWGIIQLVFVVGKWMKKCRNKSNRKARFNEKPSARLKFGLAPHNASSQKLKGAGFSGGIYDQTKI